MFVITFTITVSSKSLSLVIGNVNEHNCYFVSKFIIDNHKQAKIQSENMHLHLWKKKDCPHDQSNLLAQRNCYHLSYIWDRSC